MPDALPDVPQEEGPKAQSTVQAQRLGPLLIFLRRGTFEQDDAEIWTRITNGAGTYLGQRHKLNYQMGSHQEPDPDWPGPGVAYPINFTDVNLRNFYSRWLEMMRS